jgi:hypothetical protein
MIKEKNLMGGDKILSVSITEFGDVKQASSWKKEAAKIAEHMVGQENLWPFQKLIISLSLTLPCLFLHLWVLKLSKMLQLCLECIRGVKSGVSDIQMHEIIM